MVHMLKLSVWTLLMDSTEVEHFQHKAECVVHLVVEEEALAAGALIQLQNPTC